jgi:hypothetical protein
MWAVSPYIGLGLGLDGVSGPGPLRFQGLPQAGVERHLECLRWTLSPGLGIQDHVPEPQTAAKFGIHVPATRPVRSLQKRDRCIARHELRVNRASTAIRIPTTFAG